MRRALTWGLGIVLGAAVVHVAAVALLPRAIMRRVFAGFGALAPPNQLVHPPLATWESRTVVRPSPDLAYSSALFDVSEHPLHVVVPLSAPYTSLCIWQRSRSRACLGSTTHSSPASQTPCGTPDASPSR